LGMDTHDSCGRDNCGDVVLVGAVSFPEVLDIKSEPKRGSVGSSANQALPCENRVSVLTCYLLLKLKPA
jgi:hypothetical protein